MKIIEVKTASGSTYHFNEAEHAYHKVENEWATYENYFAKVGCKMMISFPNENLYLITTNVISIETKDIQSENEKD
jgi:LPS sulfotransferase NodH